jgi:hypothetical protein
MAGLNASGLLWVSHLGEAGRRRLRDFEREFADGHALEEAGKFAQAVTFYEALAPRYADYPKIAEIATRRAAKLLQEHPLRARSKAAKAPSKPKPKPRSKGRS